MLKVSHLRNPVTRMRVNILRQVRIQTSQLNYNPQGNSNQNVGNSSPETGQWSAGWMLGISGLGEDTYL